MSDQAIEIELKFPLLNPEKLAINLDQIAKIKAMSLYQKDTYFIPKHRNFLAEKFPFEWLRIRETSEKAEITYKHFYPERTLQHDYCEEDETIISNPNAVKRIFQKLDFQEILIVEKHRATWLYQDVEIAIDHVSNLGTYLELEAKREFSSVAVARDYLKKMQQEIGATVGSLELKGYPMLSLEKSKLKQ
ncbi:MAG: class IV adenylate cyclase [bacterium]